ncbi:MAG: OadG family protein [Oscillospiraceae bacterium]|nr:OadG family protein [Oscillospiraceae bacterium]
MFVPTLLQAAADVGGKVNTADPSFKISIGQALLYALIGFAIVFAVLLILNIFIRILSAVVRAVEGSTKKKEAPPAAAPAAAPAADSKPAIPAGMKVADGSLGDVKLYDVDDATAAMIMAIVADQLDAPLNELRFKSIKEVTK